MRVQKHHLMKAGTTGVRRLAHWLGLHVSPKASHGNAARLVWWYLSRRP